MSEVLSSVLGQRGRFQLDGELTPADHLHLAAERAAFQTYLPVSADSVRALIERLKTVPEDEFEPLFPAYLLTEEWGSLSSRFVYDGSARVVATYLRAVLAERLMDLEAMREELRLLHEDLGDHRLTRRLATEVEARLLVAEGRPEEALATLQEPLEEKIPYFPFLARWSAHYDRMHERYLRARVLFDLGQYEEAIRWSESVHDGGQLSGPILLPLTYRLEAEAFMALGEWQNAAERYERLIHLWEEADPELQPQVEAAREQLGLALDRMAAEPASL